MQKNKNPLLIVLGVCGGCVLLGIIAVAILFAMGYNKSKNLVKGSIAMAQNMPIFLNDLKVKNYDGAESLVDPSAQSTLSAAKIQKIEEAVEKKLGPMQSYSQTASSSTNNTTTNPGAPGKMPAIEYVFTYPITYKKGTATATFKFNSKDMMNPSGKVTEFTLEPDSTPDTKSP